MDNMNEIFQAEATENLGILEESLLELEADPSNVELVNKAFRAMHTIKGAGGMFGFDDLSSFTHELETVFDRVRAGEFAATPELIGVVLDAKDHISGMLDDPEQTPEQAAAGTALIARLRAAIPGGGGETEPVIAAEAAPAAGAAAPEKSDVEDAELRVVQIRLKPCANTYELGFDPKPVLRELAELGEAQVNLRTDGVPTLQELHPEQCSLYWDVTLETAQPDDAIRDAFIFVQDDWQIEIREIEVDAEQEDADRLGEILVQRGELSEESIQQVIEQKSRVGEILQSAGLVNEEQIQSALAEQQARKAVRKKQEQASQEGMVRVPARKLDNLVDLVGELVIVQARLNQLASERQDERLFAVSEELDRLGTELRDTTFSVRMLPIGSTFSRFRRLVRDLSRDLGKEIRMLTEGAETELDKMVIDSLGDPMVHLIRNSIDHGIELPADRESSGKPREGTIQLSAEHRDSNVVIRIRDDGHGIDPGRIRAKAVERGLISEHDQLTREEIYHLIFEPGFSTAEKISDISGRGVGMDVVKKSIQALRGTVSVDSVPGQGTVFTIQLPLTLAIIEGLLVAVSEERYVIPMSVVEECIELPSDHEREKSGSRLCNIRGELVPYLRLREHCMVAGEAPGIEQVVITCIGDTRFGFAVDEVVGQYQTVIKSLGKLYEQVDGIAGATILGDGGIAMILDVAELSENADEPPEIYH